MNKSQLKKLIKLVIKESVSMKKDSGFMDGVTDTMAAVNLEENEFDGKKNPKHNATITAEEMSEAKRIAEEIWHDELKDITFHSKSLNGRASFFKIDTNSTYFRWLSKNEQGEWFYTDDGGIRSKWVPFEIKNKTVNEQTDEDTLDGKFVNRGEIKLEGGLDYETAYKIASYHWDIFGQSGKDDRGVWNFQTRGNRWCCAVGMLNGKPAMLSVTTTSGRLHLLVGNELKVGLNEESGTGAVGSYSTPFAFTKNKKGSPKGIEAAKKYGTVVGESSKL